MNNESTINRRNTLRGIGTALVTAGATSLSGCAGILEGGDGSDSSQDSNNNDNNDSTAEPEPEYNEVVDVPGDADLTGSDSYSFTAGVERSENGETEMLPSDSYEIKDAYVMRDPEGLEDLFFNREMRDELPYSGPEEVVREAGLYNNILDDLEMNSDGEIGVPSDLMMPGANRLHLEIEYESGNETGSFTVDEQLQVEKSPSETMSEAWFEDREFFQELRGMFRMQIMNGATIDWMSIAKDVEETVDEKYDMDDLVLEERLQRTASHWIMEASEAINANPSGQAADLGYTLEELEDVETTTIATDGHNTVLAYDRDSDKTYHVETGRGGSTNFPPGEANYAADNPELSPIWPEQGDQVELAKAALIRTGMLAPLNSIRDEENIGEETTITAMEKFREGTDQQRMIDTLQSRGLSLMLSPSLDFKVEGDIDDVERSVEY